MCLLSVCPMLEQVIWNFWCSLIQFFVSLFSVCTIVLKEVLCFLLQVYQWRTIDGALVAIKVQWPDLLPFVLRDIYILRLGVCIFSSNIYAVALHSSGVFCCAYNTLCILSHHLAMIVFLGFGAFIYCPLMCYL
jgi:hypothetical protein